MKFNKKILAIILSVATLLTAVVVIPFTFPVEAEALYSPAKSMYSGVNIFTYSEGKLEGSGAFNNTVRSDDDNAVKLTTVNNGYDPSYIFNVSDASFMNGQSINVRAYTYMTLTYKVGSSSVTDPFYQLYWLFDGGREYTGAYLGNDDNYDNYKLESDGRWHTLIINLDFVQNTYTGPGIISSFRFDYFKDTLIVGSHVYVDSFGFFNSEAEANTFSAERDRVRNNTATDFKISADSLTVNNGIATKHNLTITQGVQGNGQTYFDIVTGKTCPVRVEGNYLCNSAAVGCFDVSMRMGVNLDLSKFNYLIIPYKYDNKDLPISLGVFPSVGFMADGTTGFNSATSEPNANYMFVNLLCDQQAYSSKHYYNITEQWKATWYFAVIDISTVTDKLYELRIDPVDYTFCNPGLQFYVDSFYFCQTQDQVTSYVNSVSSDPLTKISFNANAGGDSVSGMPDATANRYYSSWSTTNTYTFPTNTPTRSDYTFLGWSTNPDAIEAQYTPGQTITAPKEETVYYAVWKCPHGNLVINTKNVSSSLDDAQTYIFRIQGNSGHAVGIDNTVSVTGNDSITLYLPAGEYTVTCLDHWSWRYTCAQKKQIVTIEKSEGTYGLIFRFSQKNDKWLTDFGQS